MFDDDYSPYCLGASLADLDGNGKVDFFEFLMELNAFDSAMDCFNIYDNKHDNNLLWDDDGGAKHIMPKLDSGSVAHTAEKTVCDNAGVQGKYYACVQDKYYDCVQREYHIGDAIYDFFPEIRVSFEKRECENYYALFNTVYTVDRELAVRIWRWLLEEFTEVTGSNGNNKHPAQKETITNSILSLFNGIDSDSYDDDYIFDFLSEHPELENLIFATSYKNDYIGGLDFYLIYCIDKNKKENFERVYRGILSNPFRNEEKTSSYSILENVVLMASSCISEGDVWFYNFLKKVIESLDKPIKEQYLLKNLNGEHYGMPVFLKE